VQALSQALFSKFAGTHLAGYVAWLFIFLKDVNAGCKIGHREGVKYQM